MHPDISQMVIASCSTSEVLTRWNKRLTTGGRKQIISEKRLPLIVNIFTIFTVNVFIEQLAIKSAFILLQP